MAPNEFLDQLGAAMREYRFVDAEQLIQGIDPAPFDVKQIGTALGLLRRKRQFASMERLASMFFLAGHDKPVIRRQWAQSLLDQNRITQALVTLHDAAKKFETDPVEGPEIRGLIGRAYKQTYVNAGGADNLRAAIAAYRDDWNARRGDYRWQGINLVALSQRAIDDQVADTDRVDPQSTAREILEDIEVKGASGCWDYATALEVSLALGDEAGALAALKDYLLHPKTDAFELASTLRQLKEVWTVERLPMAATFLPVLEHALLQREGGSVEPTKFARPDAAGFQAVYGAESFTYMAWMDSLHACCRCVARIHDRTTGAPKGTGFLLPGRALKDAWGDAPVLLTNSHVVSDQAADRAQLRPGDAAAEFTRVEGRPKVSLGPILYSSRPGMYDITVCRLTPPDIATLFEFTPDAPVVTATPTGPQRVYVMGHPNGGELAVSMYDNSLVEHVDHYLRYRSPTKAGSSGSPVCTGQLRAFAIHHRALEDRQLNEGIWLSAVKGAL